MRIAVIGGDRRSALLCAMLAGDGHRVQTFAMEKAALPEEIPKAGCLQGCVYGADCVILPVPAESGGLINTPLSNETLAASTLTEALWPGQIVCGGRLSDCTVRDIKKAGAIPADMMLRRDYPVYNAALTAEGAVKLLIENSEKSLWRGSALILGHGRIGKLLSRRLAALDCSVTVADRSSEERAMAEALGMRGIGYSELEGLAGSFDFVVNTVPARVLSDAALCCLAEDCVLLELASPPGGFDRALAENIGLRVVYAPGLPGKISPQAAAGLIKDAVYDIIKSERE